MLNKNKWIGSKVKLTYGHPHTGEVGLVQEYHLRKIK